MDSGDVCGHATAIPTTTTTTTTKVKSTHTQNATDSYGIPSRAHTISSAINSPIVPRRFPVFCTPRHATPNHATPRHAAHTFTSIAHKYS
ncbi:hypothetical protein E2C01_063637 [Portunus trituberculatus]|uniref:Uncharacterized protein n=1 Tax=Portunus trituberculatus TaxID=210409 RepID=A0A5B7HGW7_PORTR|nr:hypothetical protein [Portunus trituberculatus]